MLGKRERERDKMSKSEKTRTFLPRHDIENDDKHNQKNTEKRKRAYSRGTKIDTKKGGEKSESNINWSKRASDIKD